MMVETAAFIGAGMLILIQKKYKYSKDINAFLDYIVLHSECLHGFTGFPYVFSAISIVKTVRITEKPYTPQKEKLCMLWGNPVIFTDCGKNPMITIFLNFSQCLLEPLVFCYQNCSDLQ